MTVRACSRVTRRDRRALSRKRNFRRAALRAELLRHSLHCTNTGCTSLPVCARYWRQHQEECLFAEVICKHSTHGCMWRGARQALDEHLEVRAPEAPATCVRTERLLLRASELPISCTAVVLEQNKPAAASRACFPRPLLVPGLTRSALQLRHMCAHFEVALAHAGQQLAALRQWRNGNVMHYAEFLWSLFAEPQSYDSSVGRWCAQRACACACATYAAPYVKRH